MLQLVRCSREKFRMQWLDKREISYVFSAFRKDGTGIGERRSETE